MSKSVLVSVLQGMMSFLQREAMTGSYEASKEASDILNVKFYDAVASLLNCEPSEIAYFDSATRAWNAVLSSIPFESGDVIVTATTEYASNYIAYLQVRFTSLTLNALSTVISCS